MFFAVYLCISVFKLALGDRCFLFMELEPTNSREIVPKVMINGYYRALTVIKKIKPK